MGGFRDTFPEFIGLPLKEKFICVSASLAVAFVVGGFIGTGGEEELALGLGFFAGAAAFWAFSKLKAKNVSWISIIVVPLLLIAALVAWINSLIVVVIIIAIVAFVGIYFIERNRHDPLAMEHTREIKEQKQRAKQEEKIFKHEMTLLKKKEKMLAEATAMTEYEQKLKMKYKDLEHQENVIKRILDHVKGHQQSEEGG